MKTLSLLHSQGGTAGLALLRYPKQPNVNRELLVYAHNLQTTSWSGTAFCVLALLSTGPHRVLSHVSLSSHEHSLVHPPLPSARSACTKGFRLWHQRTVWLHKWQSVDPGGLLPSVYALCRPLLAGNRQSLQYPTPQGAQSVLYCAPHPIPATY